MNGFALLAAVSLLVTSQSFAAAPLSWEDCVALASRGNADLAAAQASARATEDQEGVARGGLLPRLTGNLDYSRTASAAGSSFTDGKPLGTYSAGITASQNVFSGLQDLGRMRQAAANTDAALATLDGTRARISFDLKSAFEGLRYALEYRELTEEIIRRREGNLRLVELRFESGHENKGSVFLSQAYLSQARYDDLQASNARRVSSAQLARAIGVDEFSDDGIDIVGAVPMREPGAGQPRMKELVLDTPDYRAAAAQETSSDAAVSVARSAFFPTIDLTGAAVRQGPDFFPSATNHWTVTLGLSVPLFNGGRDWYGTKAAVASHTSSENQKSNAARQTLARLEQAYASYVEAVVKLKVDESFRHAATVRAEIARKRYNNGLMSFEDWDIIENDLISRQKIYLQSKRDRVLAEAAWEQAQGKGVIP